MLGELFGNLLTVCVAGTGALIMIVIAIRAVIIISKNLKGDDKNEQNRPY